MSGCVRWGTTAEVEAWADHPVATSGLGAVCWAVESDGELVGFVEEGRERESCWVEGQRHDDVVMGVIDREFAAADPGRSEPT